METQVAKLIANRVRSIMKFTLSLEEFSYREKGRNDPRYKTFKQQLMANTYENTETLFEELAQLGLIETTSNDEHIKDGYKDSPSGGSGYVNSNEFQKWLSG